MTATGGFPAPGPQDREPPRERLHSMPPAAGGGPRPQTPMLTAYRPGIVPLRPLQVSDILDGAVRAVRFNPKLMVGLSALVLALFLVPSAALGIGATQFATGIASGLRPDAEAFVGILSWVIQAGSTWLATVLLSGVLIHVLGQAVLGRKPDLSQNWQATRRRLLPLAGFVALTGLFGLLAAALLFGPGVLLLANDSIGAGLILLFLGSLGFTAVALAVSTKISMTGPAVVLEGHGVIAGVRRSFALTKGAAFWRVLGISLLAGLIAWAVGWLLKLPFQVLGLIVIAIAGQDTESGQVSATVVSHLSALFAGTITTPFLAAVTGLLYIDRRMRLEALDVVLLREAQTNPAPRN
jgi:hypothetical protein